MHRCLAIALSVAVFLNAANADHLDAARHIASVRMQVDVPWFGGLSAIDVNGQGTALTILGDKGVFLTVRIERPQGVPEIAEISDPTRLRGQDGTELDMPAGDAEGLSVLGNDRFCVAFEGRPRIACYDTPQSAARVLPHPPGRSALAPNRSYEALAVDRFDTLWTLAETPNAQGLAPLYAWQSDTWARMALLPGYGTFSPVGADFGPDGQLYILERALGVTGFRSRIRRWDPKQPDAIPTTLLRTSGGRHGNLEGIAVWRDHSGHLRATMVSDNNFNAIQRTQLVEYQLPD